MNTNDRQQNRARFELLAPAGSPEIFRAVIAAGADAVYVGGDKFGARAYANNFSTDELLAAIDFAHLHGRKVYLTVNTLLKNMEIGQPLYDYLLPFYERGLDAVLVQDFGALDFIHRAFPDLLIHTSTQMTVTGVDGARLLTQHGAKRIVMAREVSLAEMKQIHEETGVELEAFVHGALCHCYSGQCLLSSMLGGRSGNRGRCAQPCRLPYAVLDEKHHTYMSDSYVLSLKDMCGISDLNRLAEAGVYSLKIEGRMKQVPYAAGVVSYYRKYIDGGTAVSDGDMQDILDLGNRCGFTNGYYDKFRGKDMVTFVKPGYEKQNEALQEQIIEKYTKQQLRREVSGSLTLVTGQAAHYTVSCGDVVASVTGMEVMPAAKKPLEQADVIARMEKTGDTPFVMRQVSVQMDEAVFLPNGALNQLRRDALTQLQQMFLADDIRDTSHLACPGTYVSNVPGQRTNGKQDAARVICLTEQREHLSVILSQDFVTTVYLDAGAYAALVVGAHSDHAMCAALAEDIALCRQAQKEVYFAMPRIFRQHTAKRYEEMLPKFAALALDGVVVRNYEELYFVKEHLPEFGIVLDHNMYTYNDHAVAAFAQEGVLQNTVPIELNRKEIAHRNNRFSNMIVYGHYPLMTSAQCVHGNTKTCDKHPTVTYLKDRYNIEFPVKNYCSDCYNVVYNSLPVMLFSRMDELRKANIAGLRMDFTIESEAQVRQVLELYRGFADKTHRDYPSEWQERYTNGHYNRGVE